MDQAFRFLVMAIISYMIFLCIVRIVLGGQYKGKSFLINIIGTISIFGSFILMRYNEAMKLPGFVYYILVVLLLVFLPPLSLKMNSDQILRFFALSIVAVPLLHLLFSLLLGWGDYLPFIHIPSLWELL